MSTICRLSRVALVATLVLVTVGGFTRGSGSGFGCADRWPLCEDGLLGGFLPRADFNMIVEWTHRFVAVSVGVLAVVLAVVAWRNHRNERRIVRTAIGSVFVIGFQAWVGRWVVKGGLDADLVSVHLFISMIVVALFTVLVVETMMPSGSRLDRTADPRWRRQVMFGAGVAMFVLLLGSYVHNLYVGGWPLVGNTLVPDLSNRFVAVHFAHRALAAAGFGYLLFLLISARRRERPSIEGQLLLAAVIAYGINLALGAGHVFTQVGSSVLVAAHLGVAALVWACMVAATAVAYRPSRGPEERASV